MPAPTTAMRGGSSPCADGISDSARGFCCACPATQGRASKESAIVEWMEGMVHSNATPRRDTRGRRCQQRLSGDEICTLQDTRRMKKVARLCDHNRPINWRDSDRCFRAECIKGVIVASTCMGLDPWTLETLEPFGPLSSQPRAPIRLGPSVRLTSHDRIPTQIRECEGEMCHRAQSAPSTRREFPSAPNY